MKWSAVVTCYGRTDHLRVTLPRMAMALRMPIFVVGRSSHDPLLTEIRDSASRLAPDLSPVWQVEARESPGWSKPLFANTGADAAAESGATHLLFLDADCLPLTLREDLDALGDLQGDFAFVEGNLYSRDSTGLLAVTTEAFLQAGGYDEGMIGWGAEDLDLRLRLHCDGLRHRQLPSRSVSCLSHPDELRAAHQEEPLAVSLAVNHARMVHAYRARTGKWLHEEIVKSKALRELMGVEGPLQSRGTSLIPT